MAFPDDGFESSSSSSADGKLSSGFDSSGFVVNFGADSVLTGSAAKGSAPSPLPVPTWVLGLLALGAVIWLIRH